MASQFDHAFIAPTFHEHGLLVDTAIKLTEFDPRVGGYFRDSTGNYFYQAAYGPTLNGELCGFFRYINGIEILTLLCGYNDGSGLEWKLIKTNTSLALVDIDTRTGDLYDNRYLQRCMPPWVCE